MSELRCPDCKNPGIAQTPYRYRYTDEIKDHLFFFLICPVCSEVVTSKEIHSRDQAYIQQIAGKLKS